MSTTVIVIAVIAVVAIAGFLFVRSRRARS